MIRHSVILKLKASTNAAEAQSFFAAAKKLADIPGVQQFEALKQTNKKNKFDFGLSMEFASEELYDAYSSNTEHVQFIEDYWLKYVEDFLEIDYELLQ